MDGIAFENGTFGPRAVVRSTWSARFTDELKRQGTVELELNHANGWRGTDLSFLAALPELKSFEITDFSIADISPIHHLHDLRKLDVITYCSTAIDFSAFPRPSKLRPRVACEGNVPIPMYDAQTSLPQSV